MPVKDLTEERLNMILLHLIEACKLTKSYPAWSEDGKLNPIAGVRAHIEEVYRSLSGRKIDADVEEL